MTRVLALVLSLVIATAAAAAPAAACSGDNRAVGAQSHGCCSEDQVRPAAGPCCALSAAARHRAVTESRILITPDHQVGVANGHADWLQPPDGAARGRNISPPPSRGAASVSIYLQQQSLLI